MIFILTDDDRNLQLPTGCKASNKTVTQTESLIVTSLRSANNKLIMTIVSEHQPVTAKRIHELKVNNYNFTCMCLTVLLFNLISQHYCNVIARPETCYLS